MAADGPSGLSAQRARTASYGNGRRPRNGGKHDVEAVVLAVNHGIHWDAPEAVLDAIAQVAGQE